MSCNKISVTRGGSLKIQHRVSQDGAYWDITDWDITAVVTLGEKEIGEFTVVPVDLTLGHVELRANTETWHVGTLSCQVRYEFPGDGPDPDVFYSPIFPIVVKERLGS
jgi:hypothetical protein